MNKLLIIFTLIFSFTSAQDFINEGDLESKTAKGTTVIEFWAEWNKSNEVGFLGSLKDCNVYKLSIVKNTNTQKKYKILSIPTVIVLDNGVEKARFNPNIMMKLDATKKDVQKAIDNITFSKFQ